MANLQSNKLTLTKIANGTSGKGISSVVEQYAINNSSTEPPVESSQDWSSSYTPPTAINRYLWNREIITYTDTSSSITTPHVAAMYAEDGGEGRGISGISNQYAISNDGTTAPSTGWENNPMPPTSAAKYLWNKEIVTYTKGSPATTETNRVIGTYSADGAPGTNGLNQATVYLYARAASKPSAPSSDLTYTFSTGTLANVPSPWSQTFPQNNGNPCYMAIAVAISNEPTDTILSNEWTVEELVQNGQNGQNGRGISSTSIGYQISDDGTYDPSGTWLPTVPQPIAQGKWLITQTVITYTDSTSNTSYTKAYVGEDGTPGTPGQPGADGNGIASTSILYAVTNDNVQPASGSSAWQGTLPSFGEGKWLWIKTTITYDDGTSDETVSKSYTGTDGSDGTSVTITGTSYNPTTKTTTITMDDGSGTPTTISIKDGEDGENGQPGAPGADGTPSYTHFAWANSADGSQDFSTTVSEGKLYIGVYSDSTQQDSQSYTSYSWTLIKGADGEDGEDGAPGLNQATIYLYKRSSTTISTAPTATSYNFTTGQLSGVSSGWTQTIPSGTDPCYVSSAIAIGSGETDTSLTFSTPAKLVENGQNGQNGANGYNQATIYLYARQATQPSAPSTNLTYTFEDGSLSSVPSPWSQTFPQNSDNPCYMAVASAISNTSTDTIEPSDWTVQELVVNGQDGQDGQDGAPGAPGTNGLDGYNQATIFLYQRVASTPSKPTGLTYKFSDGSITGSLGNWSRTIPSGTNPCYVTSATVISRVDSGNALNFVTPTVLVENGLPGASGSNYATVYLYRRFASTPSSSDKPTGDVTYTFASGAVSGSLNSWTRTVPSGTNPCYMILAQATAAAGTATDTIAKTEWSTPVEVFKNGSDGSPGADAYNQATVYLYRRSATPLTSADEPSGLVYTFSDGSLTGSLGDWSRSVPASDGNPCYVISAVPVSQSSSVTISDWADPTELVADGQDGTSVTVVSTKYQQGDTYNTVPTGTWSDTPVQVQPGKYLWTKVIYSSGEPSYSVSRQGENGSDGAPGTPGTNGTDGTNGNNYAILYYYKRAASATAPSGTYTYNFSTKVAPTVSGWYTYIPSATDTTPCWITTITFSGNTTSVTGTFTTPTKLVENGKDGEDGAPGVTITNTIVEYKQGDSGTTPPTGSWSTSMPSIADEKYLWTRTTVTYSDSTPDTVSYSVSYKAKNGTNGTSVTITSKSVQYKVLSTGTGDPGSTGWSDDIPSANPGQYLWTRTIVNYSNGQSTTAYSVSRMGINGQDGQNGQDGAPGRGISSTEIKYIVSDQGTVPPGDGENWQSTFPSVIAAGDYLWIRTIFTYTDSTNSRSYSVAREGQNGADGKDANSFTIHTNQNQVLKFTRQLDNNSNILYEFSLPELQINAYSLIDNLNLEHQALPAPSIYYSIDIEVDGLLLSSIIKAANYTEYVETRSGDVYSYFFDYQSLYTDLIEGTISSKIQAETTTERDAIIESLKDFFDSRDSKDIHIIATVVEGNSLYTIEKYVEFQNGISSDMMKFALNAANINMAIENTGLTFDASGLTVTNGGFQILTQDGESESQRVFYIDPNTKLLHIEGDGTFSGTIYARNGEFDGLITATEGTIGGFNINYNSISSQDLTLHPTSYTYPSVPGLTQASFNANKTNYYYWDENKGRYIHCTNDSVYNSEITYHTLGEAVESHIDVKNINIGSGAVVDGQITVGNLKITNPNNNENKVITLVKDDENYFTLTNNGDLIGNNWSIVKEDSVVTARFGKLVAEDGVFNGTIYATDGRFTGEIVASVINASTINTANFITEKTRSMGGTFIFKPTFDIVELTGIGNNIIEITPSSNFNRNYLPEIVSGKDIIISLSGFDTRYGKFNSINNGKIRVEFLLNDYQTILNSNAYNSFTIFGYGNYTDVLIGVNSDDTNVIMPPRALVMEEFSNLVSGTSGIINYNTRLLLGDLSSIQNIVGSNPGYGLFADNVFLRGSLTTANVQDVAVYAGVNTQRAVDFNYTFWNQEPPSDSQTNEKIVFWGGANGTSDDNITKAPFIVTDKGSIYARSGEFKGSVISESLITKSIIKAPVIYGNNIEGTDPSLKIYNTDINNNGIGFYKLIKGVDIESNETNDVLTLTLGNTGFTHYYEDQIDQFISFNDKYVYAKGLTQEQFNSNKTNYYKLNSYNQYIQCSSTESFNANEWYFTLNSNNYINFKGTKYTAGTTTEITEHYIQDGNSVIQLSGESFNGTKISYGNSSDITITENNIVNNSTIVTNKKSMIITDDTRSLKYTVNSSGYYCLFVQ